MVDQKQEFYRQQYALLMRAAYTAIQELDAQQPERARKTLAAAWDTAVEKGFQQLTSETAP